MTLVGPFYTICFFLWIKLFLKASSLSYMTSPPAASASASGRGMLNSMGRRRSESARNPTMARLRLVCKFVVVQNCIGFLWGDKFGQCCGPLSPLPIDIILLQPQM
jgi:hypothetical protein